MVPLLQYYMEEVAMGAPRKVGWGGQGVPALVILPRRGWEVGGAPARNLARIGACADDLRLMGVERSGVFILVGRVGVGRGSLSMKVSRACGPPTIERMWSGP